MNRDTEQNLRAEFKRLREEAMKSLDAAANEARDLTAEEKSANERRFARLEQIAELFEADKRFASAGAFGDAGDGVTLQRPTDPPGRAAFEQSERHQQFSEMDKRTRAEFGRAIDQWAATGQMERRFATITTTTDSGILLPREVLPPITPTAGNAFRSAMDAVGAKPIETSLAGDLNLPVLDASAGGIVAENASSETENAPNTIGMNLKPATFQSGSAWFSNQQLASVGFDLLAYVQNDLTFAKELALEAAIASALIADAAITQEVATATTTGFTYANLVDLNRKMPTRYDIVKAIILGRDAYAAGEKLVGSDGHPVLNIDPQNQQLLRFNGTPVVRSDYFEAFGASKVIGVVVSFLGMKIRDVTTQNLARYINQPARPNQTGFNLFAYHGYGWTPLAVAKFKTPAS